MLALALSPAAAAQSLDVPLTSAPGDAGRGRTIVTTRQIGLCVLCHAGPFPDRHLHGTIAPDLTGVGTRLTAGEIRMRLVDPAASNPDSIMTSYRRASGALRPGRAFREKPILSDAAIEDVVAFLMTLKEE